MKTLLTSVAAVFIGLALFEITMQPSGSDRLELATIFILMAAASSGAALLLPLGARRSRRLVTTIFALSLVSLVVVALGLSIAASRMFISDHDLSIVLRVLGFGLLAALGFAFSASEALTSDLRNMADTTANVAQGNLAARTDVVRAD
jgi:hypothetical protein